MNSSFSSLVLFLFLFIGSFNQAQESINQLDHNGKFHGKYKKYYDNGKIRYEGTFEHGKEIGIFKFYDASGNIHPMATKEYFNNNDSIKVCYYTENGVLKSQGKMLEKSREGKWLYYFIDGKTVFSEEFYKNNLLEGDVTVYYANGKIADISAYSNGVLHGNRKKYNDEGVLLENLTYHKGILDGPAEIYNEKGILVGKGKYYDGLKMGEWEIKIDDAWITTTNAEKVFESIKK